MCVNSVCFCRPSNYTLGLGTNHVTILVVDVTHTEPWIINTYTLHVYRGQRGEDRGRDGDQEGRGVGGREREETTQVCRIVQVCMYEYGHLYR